MRDVARLIRPRTVAVIGASAARRTQGNGLIRNLQEMHYAGRIIPVHPTATEIDGLAVTGSIARLPEGIDTAVVAIPAPVVLATLGELERAGAHSAIVFTNGFTSAEAEALRDFAAATAMLIHGPNCMGLLNVTDGIRLYPSTVTAKVQPGRVALIAQSGSAAISVMNSTVAGLSRVITMGSEFQVTAPDYMRWLAADDATGVVGIVLESIKHPENFAAAAALLRAAGKPLVVLKVGKSEVGAVAAQAHTGAMISRSEAYDRFFDLYGIPTVRDYDELIASLECCATRPSVACGSRIGIVGISGGETALACDVAAELGLTVAAWSAATEARIDTALPGAAGVNPLDLGATVNHTVEQDAAAVAAIVEDASIDALLIIQDAQATLTPTMLGNYTPRIHMYGRLGAATPKPVVMVSPTGENAHPAIVAALEGPHVPVLRGLRPGMVALRTLAILGRAQADSPMRTDGRPDDAVLGELRAAIEGCAPGPLPPDLCARILAAYRIPSARSAVVATEAQAITVAPDIGFPLVLKVASPDIAHRSDVGGVERDIRNVAQLSEAIGRMARRVRRIAPHARIAGFELQEELVDRVEAMAGFIAAPPFGALTVVGSGGTLVELYADRVAELGAFAPAHAAGMIARTQLGARLGGYRNLMPKTDVSALADLVSRLSMLAADLSDRIVECDLNPVLVRKATGEASVVDALMVTRATMPKVRACAGDMVI